MQRFYHFLQLPIFLFHLIVRHSTRNTF